MRRLQHVLGMLIAMFALCSVMTLTGCKGESDTGDQMEEAADDAQDAAEDAAEDMKDAAEDAADAMNNN